MDHFSLLLSNVKQTLDKKNKVQQQIVDITKSVIGVSISSDQIIIKETVLIFTVSPTIRTVILLKKETLLKKIQECNLPITAIR